MNTDKRVVPYEIARDLMADAYNAGRAGIGFSEQVMRLGDAAAEEALETARATIHAHEARLRSAATGEVQGVEECLHEFVAFRAECQKCGAPYNALAATDKQGYDDGTGRNRDWSGAATGKQQVDPSWPLHDRVEFALRDAGFDLDEASRIAMQVDGKQAGEVQGDALRQAMRDARAEVFNNEPHVIATLNWLERRAAALADRQPGAQEQREGCTGTMTDGRVAFFLRRFKREEKLLGPHEQWAVDVAISRFEQQDAQTAQGIDLEQKRPLIARALAEWHEDDGNVMWWAWCGQDWAGEPAWCGTPNDSDWPGYHTHWTQHPVQPARIDGQRGAAGWAMGKSIIGTPAKALVAHAEGWLNHLNKGLCPDPIEGRETRDPECPVCRALIDQRGAAGAGS